MKKLTKITLAAVGLAVVIQIVPYGRDHYNPAVVNEPRWDSPRTKALFERACADCHSNRTRWPAYANIAPVSWLVTHDVNEGREHFNVSLWGVKEKNEGKKAAKELKEGEMPPAIYTLMHPKARLSDVERKALIEGLQKTFGE
ncbi:heme-binding domain-containing protein [Nitratifractor sp.]|uniref:heme-binding domain-containing protein n=1 Tax=Nitratifractor sp. TaxID=2268144 RepID=UPI0025D8D9C2|nr:heme-binding domain-containing protein [Nitratifractor sp.]